MVGGFGRCVAEVLFPGDDGDAAWGGERGVEVLEHGQAAALREEVVDARELVAVEAQLVRRLDVGPAFVDQVTARLEAVDHGHGHEVGHQREGDGRRQDEHRPPPLRAVVAHERGSVEDGRDKGDTEAQRGGDPARPHQAAKLARNVSIATHAHGERARRQGGATHHDGDNDTHDERRAPQPLVPARPRRAPRCHTGHVARDQQRHGRHHGQDVALALARRDREEHEDHHHPQHGQPRVPLALAPRRLEPRDERQREE